MPRFRTGVSTTEKGYLRFNAGPLRKQYVHRVVAEAFLGRPLTKDEEVHHRDGNRRNPHWQNLIVYGERDHGWVSSKQAWFMRNREAAEKREWDAFMAEEAAQYQADVKLAKAFEKPHVTQDDVIQDRWNAHLEKARSSNDVPEARL